MAKHPVPKKKQSHARTARRHATYLRKTKNHLAQYLNLVTCPQCGAVKLNHHACRECLTYKGRPLHDVKKAIEKVTKVKV